MTLAGRSAATRPAGATPTQVEPRIYRARTTHRRLAAAPAGLDRRFDYDTGSWLIDLDRPPVLPRPLRWLLRFEPRDHLGDPSTTIAANARGLLAEHGLTADRIMLLTCPRTLGHVFNPLSVFYCLRSAGSGDGELVAVIAEVHNTYGGRHAYLVRPDRHGRSSVDKELYVSPFNDTSGAYHVAVPLPGETVTVGVTLHREGRPPFTATLKGTARPATPRAVVSTSLRTPLAPLLGMVRIKYQGIKLWLRGLAVQPRPNHQGEAT